MPFFLNVSLIPKDLLLPHQVYQVDIETCIMFDTQEEPMDHLKELET